MPPKDWTDDEVQEEIRKAVQIVAEDRDRAAYQKLHERFGTQPDPGDGKTPPPKKSGDPAPQTKKRSLWWGDRLDSE